MLQFNAGSAVHDVLDRGEQLASGEKVVPVAAAIFAVLAALATLFANHSSVSSLSQKNEAGLYQSKAADQYGYYEATRIREQMDRALLDSNVVAADARPALTARMNKEAARASPILQHAQSLEQESANYQLRSEKYLGSYESYEVAATLFEVSVVLVSITALMRTRILLFAGLGATLVGLGFLFAGVFH